jgi:SAM-dependent methyltransferase
MSSDIPRMPDALENNSFIPTLDRQGAVWLYLDQITQAYLDFAAQSRGTFLEIAAGYGHIVIKALEAGAHRVYANEIDPGQLAIIRSRTPTMYADKLTCCLGQFPEHLDFPDASFEGIYNARLFHFFSADRIRAGLVKLYRWLKPAARVFLVNDAVYRTIFKPLIPIYEKRLAAGDEWPGFIEDVRRCIPEHLHPDTFPRTMNFMDPAVLARELIRAGFQVVTAGFYPYTGNFALGRLDGRELAGAIGLKSTQVKTQSSLEEPQGALRHVVGENVGGPECRRSSIGGYESGQLPEHPVWLQSPTTDSQFLSEQVSYLPQK